MADPALKSAIRRGGFGQMGDAGLGGYDPASISEADRAPRAAGEVSAVPGGSAAAIAAVCRAVASGAALPVAATTGLAAAALLQALVAANRLDAAAAYVPVARRAFGDAAPVGGLGFYLRHMPPADPAFPFADDPKRDLQVVRRSDARGALLVFCDAAQRFGAPLNIMHRWFAALPFHLVYLRDRQRVHYLHGIAAFGAGLAAAVAGCRALLQELGAERVVCVGHASGGYGALLFGHRLGADAVLALSGPVDLTGSAGALERRLARLPPAPDPFAPANLDLGALYRGGDSGPRVRLVHAEANAGDARQAAALAGTPGCEMIALPGPESADALALLIAGQRLAAQLAWLHDPRMSAADTAFPGEAAARPEPAPPPVPIPRNGALPIDDTPAEGQGAVA